MKCLVLVALLVACATKKPIGENTTDPDARVPNGSGSDGGGSGSDGGGGSDGSTTCSCDVSSCGSRVCGRSDCGYPCGTCAPGEMCFLGVGCNVIMGSTTPCVDAFGDNVWIDDTGLRTCPTDATKVQSCICSGSGPDSWTSCDATCSDVCTQQPPGTSITCGSSTCHGTDVCCIPQQGSDSCTSGTCPADNYTRACDGPEDCPTGSVCCGGDILAPFTTTCTPAASCDMLPQICHTGADCPTSTPYCCPALLVDGIGSCSATNSSSCT